MADVPAAEDSAAAGNTGPASRGAYPADGTVPVDPDAREALELADEIDAPEDTELDEEIVVAEVIDESPDQSVTTDPVTTDPVTGAAASSTQSAPAAGDPLTADPVTGDSSSESAPAGETLTADLVTGDTVTADAVTADAVTANPSTGAAVSSTEPAEAAAMPADTDGYRADRGLSQNWRNIQATFVDDPSGAVRLAAEAADAALSALVASLQQRQAALLDSTGDMAGAQDTEHLRTALQEYRVFCQDIEEMGRRLPQPQAMAR